MISGNLDLQGQAFDPRTCWRRFLDSYSNELFVVGCERSVFVYCGGSGGRYEGKSILSFDRYVSYGQERWVGEGE